MLTVNRVINRRKLNATLLPKKCGARKQSTSACRAEGSIMSAPITVEKAPNALTCQRSLSALTTWFLFKVSLHSQNALWRHTRQNVAADIKCIPSSARNEECDNLSNPSNPNDSWAVRWQLIPSNAPENKFMRRRVHAFWQLLATVDQRWFKSYCVRTSQ